MQILVKTNMDQFRLVWIVSEWESAARHQFIALRREREREREKGGEEGKEGVSE